LEGNELSCELSNAKGGCKDAESEAHSVVLVSQKEEESINKNAPDGNIGKDPGNQGVGINHDGTVPVDCHKGPSQWSRDNRDMDESWTSWMAEIERREVEKVDNQDKFGPPEVGADEQHDEGECEEVVGDEVGTNISGGIDGFDLAGEEVNNIADLEDEQDDPVDRGYDLVQTEATVVMGGVLFPDGSSMEDIILRAVE